MMQDDAPPEDDLLTMYDLIILHVFEKLQSRYGNVDRLPFTKQDVEEAIADLNLVVRNPPDVPYTYRTGRSVLPKSILQTGHWAIDSVKSKGGYVFVKLERSPYFDLPEDLEAIPLLDATPQIVLKYQEKDEQAVLARLRYNRLVDIFTGLTAYHLQSHFRTTVTGSQVEIDDLYIGVNTDGDGFIIPVEAKTHRERLGVIQVSQMIGCAKQRYSELPVIPIGVKALADGSFMFVEFNDAQDLAAIATRRYKRYNLYREI